jgi:N4-gp56 family major capsid protein
VNLDRELLADQAADVENALIRDDILAADSIGIYYAEKVDENFKIVEGGKIDDKSKIDPSCKITYDLCRRVLNIMERNKIPFAKGKSYHWYLHPDQKYDLMSDPKWEAMKIHTDPSDMEDGEIGRVSGMIFLESDTVLVTKDGASNPDGGKYAVYHSLVMGGDSVGQLDLGGKGVQMITKGLGSGGTADPLNQRATVGWKANLGILVTDPLAIIEVMSGSYYSGEAEATEIVYEDPQT